MHSRLLVAGLLGALALGGCHRSRTTTPDNADGNGDGGGGGGRVKDLARRAGAGHTANIDMVAVSPDGTAALTRDQIGAVRLWPRLDGSVEPIVIPVQGATTLSVASRGKDAHTVAIVDPSGSAKIFG